jgi:hypothetical protein
VSPEPILETCKGAQDDDRKPSAEVQTLLDKLNKETNKIAPKPEWMNDGGAQPTYDETWLIVGIGVGWAARPSVGIGVGAGAAAGGEAGAAGAETAILTIGEILAKAA